MEPELPPADTSNDPNPPLTTTDQQQQQTTTHALRSYECHFCKRGFTNAQALGGHMNIHRKDKNKLKHSSSSSPSTATGAANSFSISHQGNWLSATPQDEKKPLPLFEHRDTAVSRNLHQGGNPPLPEGNVDLELRLGQGESMPESSSENKTTSTTTTRKFF